MGQKEVAESTLAILKLQERVLKASGHVDKFSDFVVKDSLKPELFWRADKLLEDVMEKRMAETKDEALKKELQIVHNSADGYSKDELVEVLTCIFLLDVFNEDRDLCQHRSFEMQIKHLPLGKVFPSHLTGLPSPSPKKC